MNKIDKVCITCAKRDTYLTRICVASVRFWYPHVAIWLIKDNPDSFDTSEIEQAWDVKIFPTKRKNHGGGWTKLEAITAPADERILLIDSDIVFVGKVIEALEAYPEDFLVAGENIADPESPEIANHYYHWQRLRAFDAAFAFPGMGFNSGQMVVTGGKISEEDFAPVLSWTEPMSLKVPNVFKYTDQGMLNYMLPKMAQVGRMSLRSVNFARWGGDPNLGDLSLDDIANGKGTPCLVHWAGPKPGSIKKMNRSDLLLFFEDQYYSRVPNPRVKRLARSLQVRVGSKIRAMRRSLRARIPR